MQKCNYLSGAPCKIAILSISGLRGVFLRIIGCKQRLERARVSWVCVFVIPFLLLSCFLKMACHAISLVFCFFLIIYMEEQTICPYSFMRTFQLAPKGKEKNYRPQHRRVPLMASATITLQCVRRKSRFRTCLLRNVSTANPGQFDGICSRCKNKCV